MRQIFCDHCGDPIYELADMIPPNDGQMTKVGIRTGWGCPAEDTIWREYHRGCARELTVAKVWESTGLVPL